MNRGFQAPRFPSEYIPSVHEQRVAAEKMLLNDVVAEVGRLRGKVETVQSLRSYALVPLIIAYVAGVIALGHTDPEFYRLGGGSLAMAVFWVYSAVADVLVARLQIELALAMLAQKSLMSGSAGRWMPMACRPLPNTSLLMEKS